MRKGTLAVVAGFVALVAVGGTARAGQQQVGAWTIVTDPSGRLASMSIANPSTGLGVVESLEIVLGPGAQPTQGHLKFNSGFHRDTTPEELALYFAELEAGKAAWDYLASVNQVTKYQGGNVPPALNGRKVRLILNSGNNFFGTLTVDPSKPGGLFLAVDGACNGPIRFENGVLREVQTAG
jgi:hypothetical protein